ncbi:MAG: hypothetical protein DMG74_17010 [Acidobacteria bacterium]|nr:MAG: hypothetical protein DMG74_17010 [Acidobacteriota bacterium]
MSARVWLAVAVFVVVFEFGALCQQGSIPKTNQETQPAIKQNSATATAPIKQPPHDPLVNWRNATVAFGQVKHEDLTNRNYFSAVGTGIIISTSEKTAYLVTAKHMFCNPDERWFPSELHLRFAWQDHKSIYNYLGIPFTLRTNKGSPLWVTLDDDSDIAVLLMPEDFNTRLPEDDRKKNCEVIGTADIDSDVFEGEQGGPRSEPILG